MSITEDAEKIVIIVTAIVAAVISWFGFGSKAQRALAMIIELKKEVEEHLDGLGERREELTKMKYNQQTIQKTLDAQGKEIKVLQQQYEKLSDTLDDNNDTIQAKLNILLTRRKETRKTDRA